MDEFKKKLRKFVTSKGGKWTLIGTGIFLLVGIICLVLGFGLTCGWEEVAKWFYSPTAITLYVFVGAFLIVLAYIMYWANCLGKGE